MLLTELLALEPHGPDTWVGEGPSYPWGGLYGGQIVAQALMAASRSVPEAFAVHSLHAYFIRRGDASAPGEQHREEDLFLLLHVLLELLADSSEQRGETVRALGSRAVHRFDLNRNYLGSITAHPNGGNLDNLRGFGYDGANVYLTLDHGTAANSGIVRIDPTTATANGFFPNGGASFFDAQPFGADELLVSNSDADVIQRYRRSDGALLGNFTVTTREVGGLEVRTVASGGAPALSYAASDGLFAVSNTVAGVQLLHGTDGETLAEDPAYTKAREAAGAPDETAGFLYVDAAALAGLADGDGQAKGLAGLVAWGEQDGDRLTTQGFLAID